MSQISITLLAKLVFDASLSISYFPSAPEIPAFELRAKVPVSSFSAVYLRQKSNGFQITIGATLPEEYKGISLSHHGLLIHHLNIPSLHLSLNYSLQEARKKIIDWLQSSEMHDFNNLIISHLTEQQDKIDEHFSNYQQLAQVVGDSSLISTDPEELRYKQSMNYLPLPQGMEHYLVKSTPKKGEMIYGSVQGNATRLIFDNIPLEKAQQLVELYNSL